MGRPKKEEPKEYEIERITDHRVHGITKKKIDYYIKWKGFSVKESTWEPSISVDHATEIVQQYWARHGGLEERDNILRKKDPIKRGPNRRRKGRKRKPNVLSERPRPEKKAVADTKEVTDNIEATVEQSETKSAKTPATNRKRNRETGPSTKKVRSTEPLAKRTRAAGTSTKETKPEEPVKRAEPVKKAEPEKRARAVELPEKKKNRPFEPLSKRTRSSELSVKKPKLVEPPIKEPVLKTIKEKPNIVSSPNPSRANMSVTFSKHIDDNISQETLDDEVQDDDEEKEKEEEEEEEEEEEVNSERLEYLKKANSKINTTEDTDEEEIDDEYDEEDIITDFGFREDWDWPQDVLRLVKIQKGGDGEYEALVRWKDGELAIYKTSLIKDKHPFLLIDYYEQRLQFRKE